ncbi:reactive oxygen species modulator 1 [Artemisia annua]|uniref:Reactive oxygen species modulator 1 n=1 Tax=Artemisia annua TaxID=35608 RepID=A0A2U1KYM6_ARTAN|nr:reactive oxygen species modulator 1 [Artemisia annua]
MAKDSCLSRITTGFAAGGAVGTAFGAAYGTYDAFRRKIPGLIKIRHVGEVTLGFAATCGFFMGVGSLIRRN